MGKKRIVILGSNFSGFTAALAVKNLVRSNHDVTVISRNDHLVFHPSLTRLVLGARAADQTAFAVSDIFATHGIAFRNETALRLDLPRRKVLTASNEEPYDFLVVATGATPNYAAVPGLGPRGYTHSMLTLAEAGQAHDGFEALLQRPGPVVIGDVQGSPCRTAALELLLNLRSVLEQRGLSRVAPLTWLTAGSPIPGCPFEVISNSAVAEIVPREIQLADGRRLPFAYCVLLPSFLGADVVRSCEKITDAAGFVRVNPFGQTAAHPEVFAAGSAVAGEPIEEAGHLIEARALRCAQNLVASILGDRLAAGPAQPPVDPTVELTSSAGGWILPGPEAAWAERAFTRFFPSPQHPLPPEL